MEANVEATLLEFSQSKHQITNILINIENHNRYLTESWLIFIYQLIIHKSFLRNLWPRQNLEDMLLKDMQAVLAGLAVPGQIAALRLMQQKPCFPKKLQHLKQERLMQIR